MACADANMCKRLPRAVLHRHGSILPSIHPPPPIPQAWRRPNVGPFFLAHSFATTLLYMFPPLLRGARLHVAAHIKCDVDHGAPRISPFDCLPASPGELQCRRCIVAGPARRGCLLTGLPNCRTALQPKQMPVRQSRTQDQNGCLGAVSMGPNPVPDVRATCSQTGPMPLAVVLPSDSAAGTRDWSRCIHVTAVDTCSLENLLSRFSYTVRLPLFPWHVSLETRCSIAPSALRTPYHSGSKAW